MSTTENKNELDENRNGQTEPKGMQNCERKGGLSVAGDNRTGTGCGNLQRRDPPRPFVRAGRLAVADDRTGVTIPVPWKYGFLDLVLSMLMIRPVCSFLANSYNLLLKNYHKYLHPVVIRLV